MGGTKYATKEKKDRHKAVKRASRKRLRAALLADIARHYGLSFPHCQMERRTGGGKPCGYRYRLEFNHVHAEGRRWNVRGTSSDQRIAKYRKDWQAFLAGDETKRLNLGCRRCNAGYNPKRTASAA